MSEGITLIAIVFLSIFWIGIPVGVIINDGWGKAYKILAILVLFSIIPLSVILGQLIGGV